MRAVSRECSNKGEKQQEQNDEKSNDSDKKTAIKISNKD